MFDSLSTMYIAIATLLCSVYHNGCRCQQCCHKALIVVGLNDATQCHYVEGKIYSRTDIISDRRLQRSKHGSNCARSSEQQDMLALG